MAFTYFFRDMQTLELIRDLVLPALCSQKYINIWDAGCAHGPDRVGKVRGLIEDNHLTINSIYIFPEFEGNGYGSQVVRMFQAKFNTIIADRVRSAAKGFWQKMGFADSRNGNYVWTGKRGGNNG